MKISNYKEIKFRSFNAIDFERIWRDNEIKYSVGDNNEDAYEKYKTDLENWDLSGSRPSFDPNYVKPLVSILPVATTYTIDLNTDNNFILDCSGAFNLVAVFDASHIGKTGTIVFNNVGATIPSALPANMLTPNGADLAWVTALGSKSLISYIVIDSTSMMCNYIGNFS